MTQGRALLALFGLLAAALVGLVPTSVDAAQGDLQIIAQTFNVAADGTFSATIALPAPVASSDLSTALIAVTVYARVESREALVRLIAAAQRGALADAADNVAITPACCAAPTPGELTISVPLEVSRQRPEALSMPRAGLYPMVIAVQRNGAVLSRVLTFVNRLAGADEGAVNTDPMSVAVAIGTHSSIHLDSKATTSVDPTAVTEMTALADALDALDANAFPATVRIEPGVLGALQELSPPLFSRLVTSLQRHQVIAEPRWPIDASQAAAAGQGSLYTTWVRDGQDRLTALGLGPAVISRSTIFVDGPIGSGGAVLRRNLGAGLMVMTPDVYDGLDGSIKVFTDFKGELAVADLPDNATFDVAVVDHSVSDLLAEPLATPEETRIYVAAHLLALRQAILTSGASVQRHAVVIATPDLGVPDAALLGSITSLLHETPGLAAATLDDISLRTDRLLIEGEEQPVTLPSGDGTALQARIFRQGKLNNDINSVASMLPDDSDRPPAWRELSDLLPTSALDDASAAELDSSVRAELDEIRNAVQVPTAYTVNLPGRRSTVRVRFVNTADVPLKIKVQLSSPSGKLVFTNDPQPVVLAPGVPTVLPIPVEARSNGTSGVSLDVFTPNDVPLAPTVPLKFRVNALGVGNVLTVAVFALVLLWWLQHVRSTRRRRQRSPATLPAS